MPRSLGLWAIRGSAGARLAAATAIIILLALTCARPLAGQDSVPPRPAARDSQPSTRLATLVATPPIEVGARVRVWRSPFFSREGVVQEIRGDTLLLRTRVIPIVRPVPLRTRDRVDLRIGRASRVQGAVIGGAVGALSSLLIAAELVYGFGGSLVRDASTIGMVTRVILPYGVATGAVAGAVFPGDRWRRVQLRRESDS